MNATKILIDTNILIALEDPGVIDPVVAEFSRRCLDEGIGVHVHPSSLHDFDRDRDLQRRQASKSRHAKFPVLEAIPLPPMRELEEIYGTVRSDNDLIDVELLHALSVKAVDLLISQDSRLHRRVRGSDLEERVLTVSDAVIWLRALRGPDNAILPHVEEVKAYAISTKDPIFDTLSSSYPDFEGWWKTKCAAEHRSCWVVRGKNSHLDGLVVFKNESGDEIGLSSNLLVLKLCTFKVADHAQGTKIGELLLKKALWHAQLNNFDAVYLTTFPAQTMLIDLMVKYGFDQINELDNGEILLKKTVSRVAVCYGDNLDAYQIRKNYPRFGLGEPVEIYSVPIQWKYFKSMFPEAAAIPSLPLFPEKGSLAVSEKTSAGNTIRKVYLTKSRIQSLATGDVLFFYLSKHKYASHSQSITTVGVVESANRAYSSRELSRLVAGRSVYPQEDLDSMIGDPSGLMVIDFLLIGHLIQPVHIAELIKNGALSAPPQSISRLGSSAKSLLRPSMAFGFAL